MKLVVLVTGATSGIGLGIATRFINEGHKVIITGRRTERMDEFKRSLPLSRQENLFTYSFDIADAGASKAFVEDISSSFDAIDILINNAGLALGLDPAYQAELSQWDQMIDVNIKGLVNMTNLILSGMIKKSKGHIFNIGSVAGTYPYPGGNVYGATKAFVHEYASDLREQLCDTPIRVTSIEPGMVGGTEFSNVRFGDDSKAKDVYQGITAMSAADIADAIYWAATLPPHVGVNRLEIMPVQQTFGSPVFSRAKSK